MTFSRRTFLINNFATAGAMGALVVTSNALAQSAVLEADPQAMALGYKADRTKVDIKKHLNYVANQSCSGCALFQGNSADSAASCTLFDNKLVSGQGWCGAWTKKAGQ